MNMYGTMYTRVILTVYASRGIKIPVFVMCNSSIVSFSVLVYIFYDVPRCAVLHTNVSVEGPSETLIPIYQIIRCHIP
jgi:hypothetical protein